MNDFLPTEIISQLSTRAPVDPYAIAEALNIRVIEATLPESISGKIERDWIDNDGFMITVNAGHSEVRKRFTVAHEIAHYVLHRDLIGDGIIDNALYRDGRLGDEKERQANRYAAIILMPPRLVREAWNRGKITATDLAHEFGVSAAVADIRMRELGCVLWPKPAQGTLAL
jgi:Zn-dependent peptidase ImmA (M78 family)